MGWGFEWEIVGSVVDIRKPATPTCDRRRRNVGHPWVQVDIHQRLSYKGGILMCTTVPKPGCHKYLPRPKLQRGRCRTVAGMPPPAMEDRSSPEIIIGLRDKE